MNELLSFASVGLGGAAGALLRYECGRIFKKHLQSDFPLATFAINTSGAFLLGMITGLGVRDICYLLFGTGALGGFTTFSTLHHETASLWRRGKPLVSICYVAATYAVGIFAALAGFAAGRFFAGKII